MLFRQEALVHRKRRWEGKAVLIPPLSPLLVSGFTILFFLCLLILLISGTYTRRVAVRGELVSVPRAITLFSEARGVIVSQRVWPGERVKKGQPLMDIDISRTTLSGGVSIRQRETIRGQINTVESIISRLRENRKITLENLTAQKARYEEALRRSSDILHQSQQGIAIMKANMENYRDYHRRGLINQDQLSSQTALYYQQQNDLLTLVTQNEQNALQVMSLEGNIHTQATDFDNRIYQLEIQRSDLNRQLTDAEAAGTLVVTSPTDGRVDSVNTATGQVARASDALMQIIPGNVSRYQLVLWVPDNAAPFLRVGDKVNIRYDAFPSEKFGLYPGHIVAVAGVPATFQEMATYPSSPGSDALAPQTWYRVTVEPDSSRFVWQGRQLPAENGMKASVTLFLEERRLYQWILSPFYDLAASAGGPSGGE
ncbi:HlyD family secretion protein [Erwinia tracheiphila]|uniref:HlyD family efflux transporter periplasmic adaptor subunit n=1 Tax=Erwinia tracheiphila TaxID=65700 RepID=A0A345CP30_9GAMM|nr:HlyD family secretion protein [Erwinia tracheiphila]AXF75197.1 HlyD family efflux transporter periplasmic adaptor subunit [Erwinia tracheiphila]UIA82256.1 HlyD family secretion protein [Erwinia tracheiphila]UIA90853.1 HlyD family secretion protein [Erwinia tracheiphila]